MIRHFLVLLALGICVSHHAWSQSFCSSDGQPTPTTLAEHFINADCDGCWGSPRASKPEPRTLSIDWVVPSLQGDDAPLSAVATRDSEMRLAELGMHPPDQSSAKTTSISRNQIHQLRVAHGLSIGGYIGATIEFRTMAKARLHTPLKAWLLLVETIPAGTEGTPVERNLVRNVLVLTWSRPDDSSHAGRYAFRELRPLNIPEGAQPQRLRVVGWVQDAGGQLLSAAQSVCPAGQGK